MKLFAFAASLRKDSLNKKLLKCTVETLKNHNVTVDHAEFSEFDMPLYNYDIETQALPAGALALKKRVESAQGLIIVSPEYNFSVPGTLKNAIDWVSRAKPVAFRGKSTLLMSASPALAGGIRGLWQLRIPLEGNGAMVYPDMFTVSSADKAFTNDGKLADAQAMTRLENLLRDYLDFVRRLTA